MFYILPSSGRAVVVTVIIRDTNIIKNSFIVPILGKDFVSRLTFSKRNRQSIVSNTVWTEGNNKYVIPVQHLPLYGRCIVISIITNDTNIVKNTAFETVLRKDSISDIKSTKETNKASIQMRFKLKTITGLSSLVYIFYFHL